jgi:hypothetical protein
VGGGFSTPAFNNLDGPRVIAITSKRANRRTWTVEALNTLAEGLEQTDAPGVLTAYAYCQRPTGRLVTRTADEVVAAGELESKDVKCPKGQRAFAGGFDGNIDENTVPVTGTGVVESFRSKPRAWRFSAVTFSDSPGVLTGYAYCTRKR